MKRLLAILMVLAGLNSPDLKGMAGENAIQAIPVDFLNEVLPFDCPANKLEGKVIDANKDRTLLVTLTDGQIRVYNVLSETPILEFDALHGWLSPDEKKIAVFRYIEDDEGDDQPRISIFDIKLNKFTHDIRLYNEFDEHFELKEEGGCDFYCENVFMFSPNSKIISLKFNDGGINLYKLEEVENDERIVIDQNDDAKISFDLVYNSGDSDMMFTSNSRMLIVNSYHDDDGDESFIVNLDNWEITKHRFSTTYINKDCTKFVILKHDLDYYQPKDEATEDELLNSEAILKVYNYDSNNNSISNMLFSKSGSGLEFASDKFQSIIAISSFNKSYKSKLYDLETGQELSPLNFINGMGSFKISNDENKVIACYKAANNIDETWVYDIPSKSVILNVRGSLPEISNDSKKLAVRLNTGANTYCLVAYDIASGNEILCIKLKLDTVYDNRYEKNIDYQFSYDSNFLIISDKKNDRVQVYDLESKNAILNVPGQSGRLSQDSNVLSVESDDAIDAYNLEDLTIKSEINPEVKNFVDGKLKLKLLMVINLLNTWRAGNYTNYISLESLIAFNVEPKQRVTVFYTLENILNSFPKVVKKSILNRYKILDQDDISQPMQNIFSQSIITDYFSPMITD